ncbi:MAG: hypothetical protein IJZ94_00560 [Clostridia bacterium]|nr:hypothetical protein [Clostridia bacterium]
MDSNTSVTKPERNYGIDLLRIVSMLMVLILHILGDNKFLVAEFMNNTPPNLRIYSAQIS